MSTFPVLLLSIYLILVVYNGNANQLIAELKTDSGFIKWVLAVFVLYLIYGASSGKSKNALGQIITSVLLIFAITHGDKIMGQVNKFFEVQR